MSSTEEKNQEIDGDWSTEECVAWVKTLGLPAKHEKKFVDGINELELKGQDLIDMKDDTEIKENFGVLPVIAKKFLRKLNEAKPVSIDDMFNNMPQNAPNEWQNDDNEEEEVKVEPDLNFNNAYNNNDESYNQFGIVFQMGQRIAILPDMFTGGTKFSRVLTELRNRESWGCGSGFYYVHVNQRIADDKYQKTLTELNIQPNARGKAYISVFAKMRGGSKQNKKISRQFTQNYVKKHKKLIKMLSYEPDIISLDDSRSIRAKMPCGHVISPLSMFKYVDQSLRVMTTTKIFCPVPKCKKEWNFELCSLVACMNDKEYSKYKGVIDDRLNPKQKKCPSCKTKVDRPKDLKMLRVNCGLGCGDFCFLCSKKWKSSSMTVCGDKLCPSFQINKTLLECQLIKLRSKVIENGVTSYKDKGYNVKIPEIRACVNCLTLIAYDEACKHMSCTQCKVSFCFSCLRRYDSKKGWQCKGAYDQCPNDDGTPGFIAPRQQF